MSEIGFPGLGLHFSINRTAFTLFGINVQWYGIILTTGIIVAFFLLYRRAIKTEGIKEDDVLNVTLFTVPIAIIGARITFVLTSLDKYDSFWEVFEIWKGGIAIYGAIIFGGLTVLVYSKVKKIKPLKLLDAIAPAVMMGQIIGRWGNFVNAEAYGWSAGVENLPWRMTVGTVRIDDVIRTDIEFVHPTFLYESLWNLIGFIVLQLVYRKKKKDGEIFLLYVMWYGLGRGLIEMLRTDSLRVFGIKLFVVLGLASFVIATILFILLMKSAKKDNAELDEYTKAYCAVDAYDTENVKAEGDDPENGEEHDASDNNENEDKKDDGGNSNDPA